MVSHEKVFNEAMCIQDDVYLLIFFHKSFYKKDIYYVDCVSPKWSHGVI
jgi:hypothetical protein